MALANPGRNRRRTMLVIVSMTLSLVLFNTVFTLSGGFDIDKYIAKFLDTDFVISTTDYFQFQFEKSKNDLPESFIEAVRQHECFGDGGRLYTSRILEESFSTGHGAFSSYNRDPDGNPFTDLYGADDFLLNHMEASENTATTRNTGEARFYLPTEIFLPLCDNPHLVSFPFDVKTGTEAEMAEFLNNYTDSVEPGMDFESKETYTSSFDSLTSLIITIGGALSIIIGIIGIANFVNSVLTSVITRKKEFAMPQSIGMTGAPVFLTRNGRGRHVITDMQDYEKHGRP